MAHTIVARLPSCAYRVRVYGGEDPVTSRAAREADKVRTRLLAQLDERRNPRTSATLAQLLDRHLKESRLGSSAVERIRPHQFFGLEGDQVAVVHGRGTDQRFAGRHHGEHKRKPCCLPDTTLHRLGEPAEVGVAGYEFGPRRGMPITGRPSKTACP
jgi:hypothetical protein